MKLTNDPEGKDRPRALTAQADVCRNFFSWGRGGGGVVVEEEEEEETRQEGTPRDVLHGPSITSPGILQLGHPIILSCTWRIVKATFAHGILLLKQFPVHGHGRILKA